MFALRNGFRIVTLLYGTLMAISSIAQPTLPDLTGTDENGFALLSWTCQYDGVKSISVLRSSDSNFNYYTVGYVKKLYKGTQAFIDGHPMPGKNFYKLSIVFNSGLTWGSNHYGVYIDSTSINTKRIVPSNEALQKLIVTETTDKNLKTAPIIPIAIGRDNSRNALPADRTKYTEVLKKEMAAINDTAIKRPKFKFNTNEEPDERAILATIPEDTRHKIAITYDNDTNELNPAHYLEDNSVSDDPKKKINITFDDKDDVSSFMETLPKSQNRKITISYNEDTDELNEEPDIIDETELSKKTKLTKIAIAQPKKISITFKDEKQVNAYMATLPKTSRNKITVSYNVDSNDLKTKNNASVIKKPSDVVRPKISIKFTDDLTANPANSVQSKYIKTDPVLGHVKISLPDDIATHTYSIKFFDKDNHAVIEVPKINTQFIIMDKRNFQKKGQYKFTIRKDVTELESGYITIY